MSLQSQPSYPIPEDARRIARAAFPKGNLYMRMRVGQQSVTTVPPGVIR